MINRICVLICFVCCVSCKHKKNTTSTSPIIESIAIKTYDFKNFEKAFLQPKTEKIQVINFWATWCKPCVKELPFFEELSEKNKAVEVILVSLDLNSQKESKLIPFVKAQQLKSTIIHMDEPDADAWIPKVDKDWSGAIPATLIINKNKKMFYEQSFNYEELVEAVNSF